MLLQPARRNPHSSYRPRRLHLERLEERTLLTADLTSIFPAAEGEDGLTVQPAEASRAIENVQVTEDAGVQQMPSVAVNPLDAEHVVIAYMDYSLVDTGYAGIGVAVSRDGGESWQHSRVPAPEPFNQGAANPRAKFDAEGRLFVSYMAATFVNDLAPLTNPKFFEREPGFQSHNGVFVAQSNDGGTTWNEPVAVASHLYDGSNDVNWEVKPDLAIDTFATLPDGSANPLYGNMYAAWTRLYAPGQFPAEPTSTGGGDLMIAVSEDGGATWDIHEREQDGALFSALATPLNFGTGLPLGVTLVDQANIAVGPFGDLYVSSFWGGNFLVWHSTDGGRSFDVPGFDFETFTGNRLVFSTNFTAWLNEDALPMHQVRTVPLRGIAADVPRPGQAYAIELLPVRNPQGDTLDVADLFFARTTDFGETWATDFTVAENRTDRLNDDNDGQRTVGDEANDVIASQFFARMAADSEGNVGVIWYDTRRDPDGRLIDVFGTLSSDGGLTFGPNFRIATTSFDADLGAFINAIGEEEFDLGETIGLAMAANTAFAAWTDTRNGNQDIFFARFSISPSPRAPEDRFEPNDSPATATPLSGKVQRNLPKLSLRGGDEDWFEVEAIATGELIVTGWQAEPGKQLRLELWNADGSLQLASGADILDEAGEIAGAQIRFAAAARERFLLRVLPAGDEPQQYSLEVQSLTADLGTSVYGVLDGGLQTGDEAYYLLRAAAAGTLEVTLSGSGDSALEVLDASDLAVVASGPLVSVPVQRGQALLLRVGGVGEYALSFRNLDQVTTPQSTRLVFPAGAGPASVAVEDMNADGHRDLVVANGLANTVSVLLGNGDGTFQAERQFAIGAFAVPNPVLEAVPFFGRRVVIRDFNGDRIPDIVATNYDSSDVSVLLGRGDGAFDAQRRFDATAAPFGLEAGDVNGDGHVDIVVGDSKLGIPSTTVAILLGRGDGSFLPQRTFDIPTTGVYPATELALVDLNGDGFLDLIHAGDNEPGVDILLGQGDGTFQFISRFDALREAPEVSVDDLDGDGHLDLVVASFDQIGEISILFGNGDGTFEEPLNLFAGQSVLGAVIVDFGQQVVLDDGSFALGPPDGQLDIVVAASGVERVVQLGSGPEIVILPGLRDENGEFLGFGSPQRLSSAVRPLGVVASDVNADGLPDLVVVDRDGVLLVFGAPPQIALNTSPETARDLGAVVHHLEPTQTIVPDRQEAWFRLQAPHEAASAAGDQVLDFSAGFAHLEGPGLASQVLDADGNVLGEGPRLRLQVAQGEELFVRIFSVEDIAGDRGFGAFTLNIAALPQVVGVEAVWPIPGVNDLPGGPVSSLVITLQGERLDLRAAQDPANYRVTWLGADGIAGTADDREMAISGTGIERPVVYNASSNVEISSGQTFPTAVRQTVTLVFGQPLPAGNYRVTLAPGIQAQRFNEHELDLLSETGGFDGHPVVSVVGGQIREGAELLASDLVPPTVALGDLGVLEEGTRFFTQLQNDLGSLLDAELSAAGDNPQITAEILDQIVARLNAALGPEGERIISLLVVFLDPLTFFLADPDNRALSYNLQTNAVANNIPQAFVEVGGNVELVVIANPQGTYELTVADVPARARGGVIYFGNSQTPQVTPITRELLGGERRFSLSTTSSFQQEVRLADGPNPGLAPSLQLPLQLPLQSPAVIGPLLATLGAQIITAPPQVNGVPSPAPQSAPSVPGRGSGMPIPSPLPPWLLELWEQLREIWDELFGHLWRTKQEPEAFDVEDMQQTLRPSLWQALIELLNDMQPQSPAPAAIRDAPAAHVPEVTRFTAEQIFPPQAKDRNAEASGPAHQGETPAASTAESVPACETLHEPPT
jgi:hypothetical protein